MPPSHCPKCSKHIAWYHNIPLISYIILKGQCSSCKENISFEYFVVEFITGITSVALFLKFGMSFIFLVFAAMSVVLIIITFIDFHTQLIPDTLSYPLLVIGLITSFINPLLSYSFPVLFSSVLISRFINAFAGLLIGGGVLWIIAWVSQGGMGGGDIKLMAALGAFLGWKLTLLSLMLAFLLGGIIAVILLLTGIKKRKDPIPFGPYLCIGALIVIVFQSHVLNLYYKFLNI